MFIPDKSTNISSLLNHRETQINTLNDRSGADDSQAAPIPTIQCTPEFTEAKHTSLQPGRWLRDSPTAKQRKPRGGLERASWPSLCPMHSTLRKHSVPALHRVNAPSRTPPTTCHSAAPSPFLVPIPVHLSIVSNSEPLLGYRDQRVKEQLSFRNDI